MKIHTLSLFLFTVLFATGLLSCDSTSPETTQTTGTISGIVVDSSGSPVEQALIYTVPPTSQIFSAAQGNYKLENVSPGAYSVLASRSTVGSGTASISVIECKTTTANIILSPMPPTKGSITGKVLDADGSSVDSVTISTLPQTIETISSTNGDFVLANIEAGTYTLVANKSGFTEGTKSVVVLAGKVTGTTIILGREGALPTNGLIASYPLDGDGNDVSGNNFHLSLSNTSFISSRLGGTAKALVFDGVSSEATGVHNAVLDPAAITLSFWIKAPQPSLGSDSGMTLLGKYINASVNGYVCYLQGPKIIWYYAWGNPNHTFCRVDNTVTDNNWHHILGTADGNGAKLFIDGVLVETNTWLGTSGVTTQTAPITLGFIEPKSFGGRFVGAIDDIRIYNRVLSEKEITDLSLEK